MAIQLGADGDAGDSHVLSDAAFIAERIAARYAHPERVAYLYLFHLKPGVDLAPVPPDPDNALAAWYDEGSGLKLTDPAQVAARCQASLALLQMVGEEGRQLIAPADRRRLMARLIVFNVNFSSETENAIAKVDFFNRALAFTPKGDRHVIETWKRADGGWLFVPPRDI